MAMQMGPWRRARGERRASSAAARGRLGRRGDERVLPGAPGRPAHVGVGGVVAALPLVLAPERGREGERRGHPSGCGHFLLGLDKNAFVGPSSSWSLPPASRCPGVSAGREELPGGAVHLLQLARVQRPHAPVEAPVPRYCSPGPPGGDRGCGWLFHVLGSPTPDGSPPGDSGRQYPRLGALREGSQVVLAAG